MLGEYDFEKDLPKGQEAEIAVARIARRRNSDIIGIKMGDNGDRDLLVVMRDGTATIIEVKNDIFSKFTKNVAIEMWDRGHDSGITTTKALYWVQAIRTSEFDKEDVKYHLDENTVHFFITEVSKLKELIRSGEYQISPVGDYWEEGCKTNNCKSARAFLIPKIEFIEISTDMQKMDSINFDKLIKTNIF